MKRFIRVFPLHAFLIGPAIILFLYAHNYDDIIFDSTRRSFIVTTFICFILFALFYIAFGRNKIKAALFSTLSILCLFSYGSIYDLLEHLYYSGFWPFANIHRYLILFYILFLSGWFIFIFRSERPFATATKALNVFTYALIIFNFVIIVSKAAAHPADMDADNEEKTTKLPFIVAPDSLPDIYYIILDGYANDSILKEYYHYPKNSLTDHLHKNGFYIASRSRGNYLVTRESLGSSLNYSYNDTSSGIETSPSIFKNKVCGYLKEHGYKIVHVRSGYNVSRDNYYADTIFTFQNLNEFERTLLRYTIFRLDDLTGYVHYLRLIEELDALEQILPIRSPKFSFIHIVSPHPPYTCDENGKFRPKAKMINTWWETREDYLQQLKFINSRIISFVDLIIKSSKRKPIIIIQSDHGPWIKEPSLSSVFEARSLILNAYLVPESWKKNLYDSITPVNSFPFIFNNLFRDSIPAIKDVPMDSISMKKYTQVEIMTQD